MNTILREKLWLKVKNVRSEKQNAVELCEIDFTVGGNKVEKVTSCCNEVERQEDIEIRIALTKS